MAIRSAAQKKAVAKYNSANYEQILVRVNKGEKEAFSAHAQRRGESLNAFANQALHETMERDAGTAKEV